MHVLQTARLWQLQHVPAAARQPHHQLHLYHSTLGTPENTRKHPSNPFKSLKVRRKRPDKCGSQPEQAGPLVDSRTPPSSLFPAPFSRPKQSILAALLHKVCILCVFPSVHVVRLWIEWRVCGVVAGVRGCVGVVRQKVSCPFQPVLGPFFHNFLRPTVNTLIKASRHGTFDRRRAAEQRRRHALRQTVPGLHAPQFCFHRFSPFSTPIFPLIPLPIHSAHTITAMGTDFQPIFA